MELYKDAPVLHLYTDGSGTTGGHAGWAFALAPEIEEGWVEVANGYLSDATNNVAELMGVIRGLEYCIEFYQDYTVVVHSDSAYIVNCMNDKWYEKWLKNGWKNSSRKPVANKEYWEYLLDLKENLVVEFKHVKAHTGNELNELCDSLANEARINRVGS